MSKIFLGIAVVYETYYYFGYYDCECFYLVLNQMYLCAKVLHDILCKKHRQ